MCLNTSVLFFLLRKERPKLIGLRDLKHAYRPPLFEENQTQEITGYYSDFAMILVVL